MKVSKLNALVLGLLLISALAGCAPPSPAAAPTLNIESAWGMPSTDMPTAGGMFMLIKNSGTASDKLLSAKSPACGSVEVHETVMKSDGTMGMNLVENPVEIPAGGQVELKSGDLHIMCIMRKDDLFKPGSMIDLTLAFEKSGEKTVSVEVRGE